MNWKCVFLFILGAEKNVKQVTVIKEEPPDKEKTTMTTGMNNNDYEDEDDFDEDMDDDASDGGDDDDCKRQLQRSSIASPNDSAGAAAVAAIATGHHHRSTPPPPPPLFHRTAANAAAAVAAADMHQPLVRPGFPIVPNSMFSHSFMYMSQCLPGFNMGRRPQTGTPPPPQSQQPPQVSTLRAGRRQVGIGVTGSGSSLDRFVGAANTRVTLGRIGSSIWEISGELSELLCRGIRIVIRRTRACMRKYLYRPSCLIVVLFGWKSNLTNCN